MRAWKQALFSYTKFRKETKVMSEVKIFNNEEFGEIRTVSIDGEPWFVGKDVAEALGYVKARNAIATHVEDDDKKDAPIQGDLGGTQLMTIINESGLYALIFGSKLESAKRFKHWITSEVLPSIRKHGIYATDNVIDNIMNNPDFGIQLLTKLKEERAARVEAERRNTILTHVNKTYTMIEIAKELNMKSATQLNRLLAEKRIQYHVNGTWVITEGLHRWEESLFWICFLEKRRKYILNTFDWRKSLCLK